MLKCPFKTYGFYFHLNMIEKKNSFSNVFIKCDLFKSVAHVWCFKMSSNVVTQIDFICHQAYGENTFIFVSVQI